MTLPPGAQTAGELGLGDAVAGDVVEADRLAGLIGLRRGGLSWRQLSLITTLEQATRFGAERFFSFRVSPVHIINFSYRSPVVRSPA